MLTRGWIVGVAMVVACTDGTTTDDIVPTTGDPTIIEGDGATITVPFGATDDSTLADLVIEIATPPVAVPDEHNLVSEVFAITPHGTTFDERVTISIPHTAGEVGLATIKLDSDGHVTWYTGPPAVDEEGLAVFTTKSLSYYAIIGPPEDKDQDGYDAFEDCDDNNEFIFPGATEECDGIDNDCDQEIDDGLNAETFWQDLDEDELGNASVFISACAAPPGYIDNSNDCDDTDDEVLGWALDAILVGPLDDVQDAIDSALNGDTIAIKEWTHIAEIVINADITLTAACPAGAEISGDSNRGPVITINGGSPLIENLSIVDGSGDSGAGIHIAGGTPTIHDCIIDGNLATGVGGGIYVASGATATIYENNIKNNEAASGAGIYVSTGAVVLDSTGAPWERINHPTCGSETTNDYSGNQIDEVGFEDAPADCP